MGKRKDASFVIRAFRERELGLAPKDNFIAISPEFDTKKQVNDWIARMALKHPEAKHFRIYDAEFAKWTWRKRPHARTLARTQGQ